jgi:hypothetical protein
MMVLTLLSLIIYSKIECNWEYLQISALSLVMRQFMIHLLRTFQQATHSMS